jgi:acyl CoA:acetate/3-ketoacid CoA transferase alpha subunit/acyl CoA:acetate/3-ketoacid CoA transferase beta subunit
VTKPRSSIVITRIADAAELVVDGATIGIGGSISAGHPMAVIREVIRRRTRNLTIVAPTAGLDVDLLIAAGCVSRVITAYVGGEDLASIGPAWRAALETGTIEVRDLDEAHCVQGLRAAAQQLPFLPWRGGVGTSLPELDPELVEFRDPINGELLLAVPALPLDVAIICAEVSDVYGNAQLDGLVYMDPLLAGAAAHVIVQADEIVSNDSIRACPERTKFWDSTSVVHAPRGSHPFASSGLARDDDHLAAYVVTARRLRNGDREGVDAYLKRFIYSPADHGEYMDLVDAATVTPPSAVALEWSPELELMAVALARDVRADDRVIQSGANLPEARAAAILAGYRVPDSRVIVDLAIESVERAPRQPELPRHSFDPRTLRWGEAQMSQHTIFDEVGWPDVFFIGGLEVDQRGNVNLLGKRGADGRWEFRGPGALALASMSTHCRGYYIVMRRHESRTFVERVSLISALGDRERRAEVGLPGGGPRLVVSPLGVFDFDESGDMRVRSLHPGVHLSDVFEATGFKLKVEGPVQTTGPPTDDERSRLRELFQMSGRLHSSAPMPA